MACIFSKVMYYTFSSKYIPWVAIKTDLLFSELKLELEIFSGNSNNFFLQTFTVQTKMSSSSKNLGLKTPLVLPQLQGIFTEYF